MKVITGCEDGSSAQLEVLTPSSLGTEARLLKAATPAIRQWELGEDGEAW